VAWLVDMAAVGGCLCGYGYGYGDGDGNVMVKNEFILRRRDLSILANIRTISLNE
jgi:hypothetical protein